MARKGLNPTLVRPKRELMADADPRKVKRASFDIYADQLERLGILTYTGGGTISDLVKEALDAYLSKRHV